MAKFKAVVTRTDEYLIEIDENVINEEWMDKFRESYYPYHDLEDHAKHLAQHQARFGAHNWPEGYGMVKVNGEFPYNKDPNAYREEGINIKIISEDDQCEVDVEEVKNAKDQNRMG